MLTLLAGGIAIFLGSLIQGSIGFGFSLIVVPVLLLLLPQENVVLIVVFLSFVLNALAILDCYLIVQKKLLAFLLISSTLGIPLGVALLTAVDAQSFKFGVGILIILLAIVLASGWKNPYPVNNLSLLPVGFIAGILNGSIALSGPMVVLFFSSIRMPKAQFRANLFAYFLVLNVITMVYFLISDLFNAAVLTQSGLYCPILLLGTFLGAKLSKKVPEGLFRKVTLLMIGIMGMTLAITNLPDFFL